MNETQYDRAWKHFNVPKLEIQRKKKSYRGALRRKQLTDWLAYTIKYTQHTHICAIKC